MSPAKKTRKKSPERRPRKDRLIQTRVPEDLETTLKEEAERRRLTVSHLIRSILEDTFQLVDDVVTDFDKVVTDWVDLARNVSRNAMKLAAQSQRDTAAKGELGLERSATSTDGASWCCSAPRSAGAAARRSSAASALSSA